MKFETSCSDQAGKAYFALEFLREAYKNGKLQEIAYHEVAHALLLHKYKQNFNFYKAAFGKECASGLARFFSSRWKRWKKWNLFPTNRNIASWLCCDKTNF